MGIRSILYLGIAGAMSFFTWSPLDALARNNEPLSTWDDLKFGVILTFAVTGVPAFVGYVVPLWRTLPDTYYRVRNRRRLERLADRMGMDWFRSAILAAYWNKHRADFFDGRRSGLGELDRQTRVAEFGHLAAGLLVLPIAVWLAMREYLLMATVAVVTNLFMNGYPIVLQRLHRARLALIQERGERRSHQA